MKRYMMFFPNLAFRLFLVILFILPLVPNTGYSQSISKEEYVRRLAALNDRFSDEIGDLSSNRVYLVFNYMKDEEFEDFMKLDVSLLMSLTETYGRPDDYGAKRMYYKLHKGGGLYPKFNEFFTRGVSDLKGVINAIPEYSAEGKSRATKDAKEVMDRYEQFLTSFKRFQNLEVKKNLSDYDFSKEDKELVNKYFRQYGTN